MFLILIIQCLFFGKQSLIEYKIPDSNVILVVDNKKNIKSTKKSIKKAWTISNHSLSDKKLKPIKCFIFSNKNRYKTFIDELVEQEPYLEGWGKSAKESSGFVLYRPVICCILDELYQSLDNVIAHQLALSILYSHYGVQPYWLREAFALNVEGDSTSVIYSIGGGTQFIPINSEKGWKSDIKTCWRKANENIFNHIISINRNKSNRSDYILAMGFVRALMYLYPNEFKMFLKQVEEDYANKSLGSPNYCMSIENQIKLFDKLLHDDWRNEIIAKLRNGVK